MSSNDFPLQQGDFADPALFIMGFRGSRVELRPLRGLAPLAGLRPAPAARGRARQIPPSRLLTKCQTTS